jgi:hypothetical protein
VVFSAPVRGGGTLWRPAEAASAVALIFFSEANDVCADDDCAPTGPFAASWAAATVVAAARRKRLRGKTFILDVAFVVIECLLFLLQATSDANAVEVSATFLARAPRGNIHFWNSELVEGQCFLLAESQCADQA